MCLIATQFFQIVSRGGRFMGRSFSALVGLARSAVPDTRKCLEATPQDLLFVVRLQHWLPQHLHFYTRMSLKKQYTEKKKSLNSLFFCLLLSKKLNQISSGCFCVSGIPEERLKEFFFTYSRCSVTAPCGAAQFIHLLFPAQILCLCLILPSQEGQCLIITPKLDLMWQLFLQRYQAAKG